MPPEIYIIASRLNLAEHWMWQNEKFLRIFMKCLDRPKLFTADCWRTHEFIRGLPPDSLIILVDLPFRYFGRLKQIYPHHTFLLSDLE